MKLLLLVVACFAFFGTAWAAADLNTATRAQLESVKGIGPAKAQAIIAFRSKHGPFKSVDELDKVKGFGKKSIDKVRAEITVSRVPAPAKAVDKGKLARQAKVKPSIIDAGKK